MDSLPSSFFYFIYAPLLKNRQDMEDYNEHRRRSRIAGPPHHESGENKTNYAYSPLGFNTEQD